MTTPRRPRCAIHSKAVYPDEGAALTAAVRNASKFHRPQRPYRCPDGFGWHLTTQSNRFDKEAVGAALANCAGRAVVPPKVGNGFLPAPPLRHARELANDDLKGGIDPTDLAWLYANRLLWLRALVTILHDAEERMTQALAQLKRQAPAPGAAPSVEYLAAKAAYEAVRLKRLRFLRHVKRRIEEVKSLVGPQPLSDAVASVGDVAAAFLRIAELVERGEQDAAGRLARMTAEKLAGPDRAAS